MNNYEITLKNIPEQYRDIAELFGIDVFLKLCDLTGGDLFYLPTRENLFKEIRNEKIKEEYLSGISVKKLSQRYALSGRWIRELVKPVKTKRSCKKWL